MYGAQSLLRKGINEHILNEMRSRSSRPPTALPIGSDDLAIHAKIYTLADKYLGKGLKSAVLSKFGDCAANFFKGEKFSEAAGIVFTTSV